MPKIVPTVTAEDRDRFLEQYQLVSSFADRIHLDIMDGIFAPTVSPTPDVEWFNSSALTIDIHIMHKRPELVIDQLVELKPSLIIIHAESDADVPLLATTLRSKNIKTGLAILPDTELEAVDYILPHIQHVLIFGGHLGYHGGVADLSALDKSIIISKKYKHLEIGWDGGANISNIPEMVKAGIDVVNVGGAIHGAENPQKAYLELTKLAS